MSEKEEALSEELRLLRDEVRQITAHRLFTSQSTVARIVAISLARGLAFGLGSVVGATVLVSVLVWWLSQFEFLPIIGDWLGRLVDQIEAPPDPR